MKGVRYSAMLLLILSCGVDLQVPADTTIACKTDADCLNGLVCDGVCVASLDTDPPGLVNVDTPDTHTVRFVFDEPILEASVAMITLTFSPALEIYGTAFDAGEPTAVMVATPELVPWTTYAITVGNLTDRSGNALSPDPSATTITIAEVPTDTRAPDLLSPEDGAVTSLEASLVWSSRTGATSYTLEVARDSGFTTMLGTYEIPAPDTAKTVTLDDARSFYWRVRSNLSVASSTHRFDALGSTIYVYCPTGDSCADKDSSGNVRRQTGSKDAPYFLPSRGVFAAQTLNAAEVRIAARGGAAAYNDSLAITSAINISGGYDSTFADSTYNPATHPTVLSALTSTMTLIGVVGPMLVKGLELITTDGAEGVLTISACDGVQFDRIYAHGSNALQVSDIDSVTHPTLITNSRFEASLTSAKTAVLFGSVVRDSVFVSETAGGNCMDVDRGALVERSTIVCSKGTSTANTYVGVSLLGASTLRNNVIISDNSLAALVLADGPVTIVGNTLVSRILPPPALSQRKAAAALLALKGPATNDPIGEHSGAIITNNLFVSLTANAFCFSANIYADPGSFQNNVFAGCTPKVYGDFGRSLISDPYYNDPILQPQPETAETALNRAELEKEWIHSGCFCQHGRYDGNVISPLSVTALFVDYDGPDNQLFTVDDNNMRLLLTGDTQNLKQAGRNPTATDCGPQETSTPCGGDDLDITGATRGTPWSVGAYEKN